MAGNTLGPRKRVAYTSDSGAIYNLDTDANLADASGLPAATPGTGSRKPSRFKPRCVFVDGSVGGVTVRKELVVNADSPLYDTDSSSTVTIDTVTFTTTGRRGETLSF